MDPPVTGAASWPGWCRRWRGATCTSAPAPGWPGPSTPWCGGTRSSSTGPLPPHSPPSPPLWLLAETLQYAPFVTVVFVTFLFVSALVPPSCTCPPAGTMAGSCSPPSPSPAGASAGTPRRSPSPPWSPHPPGRRAQRWDRPGHQEQAGGGGGRGRCAGHHQPARLLDQASAPQHQPAQGGGQHHHPLRGTLPAWRPQL